MSKESRALQNHTSSENADATDEYLNTIRGVQKCQNELLDGQIVINPINATDGKMNLNLRLNITEELYKVNFVIGEREIDKLVKYNLKFKDETNPNIFDLNSEILKDITNNIFKQT